MPEPMGPNSDHMPHRTSKALLAAAVWAALGCSPLAHAQLRVVEWNVTNFSPTSGRDAAFRTAFYGIAPNGLQMAPDVVVIQEVSEAGGQAGGDASVASFLNILNLAVGSPGDWVAAPYMVNGGDTGNALFYRSTRVVLMGTTALTTNTGTGPNQAPRDTQRWQIRPVGYTSVGAQLYIYGAHFKAGSTSADQLRRDPEGERIRIDANALNDSAAFLLCADLNVQCSCQTFYQYMVGASGTPAFTADLSGQFFDPINTPGGSTPTTDWENNSIYRYIHTQDPTSSMDSRHDQILISANLRDGQGLDYMPAVPGGNILSAWNLGTWNDPNHSYRAWGNDGSSFNGPLNMTTNQMVGPVIATALKDSAASGGHLPVYIDLQVPAKVSAPANVSFGNVSQGSLAQQTIQVGNGANLALWSKDGTGRGVDVLDYTLAASAGFTVAMGPFADAAGNAVNSHIITMNTATTGPKSGTLTITSDDPDTPVLVVNLTGTVNSAFDYDVDNDGLVDINDLYRWYGLFTDVDGNGTVDLNDVIALRAELRRLEAADMAAGRS